MTTYRLYPSAPGPALVSFQGAFRSGVVVKATKGGCWFDGWWWWVPSSGDTGAQEMALWAMTGESTGVLVASAMSPALTAGAWNFIPYAGHVNLAMGMPYLACTGWTAVAGFPSGNGAYAVSPVSNGPLLAYSDTAGSAPSMYGTPQGTFDVSGAPVTSSPCTNGSNSANFGMDVQISDVIPAGFIGSFSLFSHLAIPAGEVIDSMVAYTVGNQANITEACTVNNAWFYSDPAATALPDKITVWTLANAKIVTFTPSWSGAPGSGWVSAPYPAGTVLAPGQYRVTAYCSTGGANLCFCTINSGDPWGPSGIWAGGIANGPLFAPDIAGAALGWNYAAGDSGSTPPFTDGTQRNAQSVFGQSPVGAEISPQLVAAGIGGSSQGYPVDLEVTPVPSGGGWSLPVMQLVMP